MRQHMMIVWWLCRVDAEPSTEITVANSVDSANLRSSELPRFSGVSIAMYVGGKVAKEM